MPLPAAFWTHESTSFISKASMPSAPAGHSIIAVIRGRVADTDSNFWLNSAVALAVACFSQYTAMHDRWRHLPNSRCKASHRVDGLHVPSFRFGWDGHRGSIHHLLLLAFLEATNTVHWMP